MSIEVLVAGELYVDLIMSGFDFWPEPGQEAFARQFQREIGGGAAITAFGLAALGTRTGVFGVAGCDQYQWMSSRFRECGVDTGFLKVDEAEPSGFTVAVSAPTDRAFFTYLGANRGFAGAFAEAASGRMLHTRHVHLGFAPDWNTAGDLFDAVHANGCTVSVDAGWHEAWLSDNRALDLLRKVDLFFPNEVEAARVTGETDTERMLQRFKETGVPAVALKLGSEGAALLIHGEIYRGLPIRVTVVDTTGAGDCFDAGFLHAWIHSEPPESCLRMGNICGALCCEAYGGIDGFPTRERLQKELERASWQK
jgi:sugar/nucleoside kinase (ribokinase family)